MARTIRFSTAAHPNATQNGAFQIATRNSGMGRSSTSGFYSMIEPPTGGYTFYQNKATNGPSIILCHSDQELLTVVNAHGHSFTTVSDVLLAAQSGAETFTVTTGLELWLDARNPASYDGTTIWKDLSGYGHHATLVGNVQFSNNTLIVNPNQTTDVIVLPNEPLAAASADDPANWTIQFTLSLNDLTANNYFCSIATPADQNAFILQKNAGTIQVYNETLLSGSNLSYTPGELFQLTVVNRNNITELWKNETLAGTYSSPNNLATVAGWALNQEQDGILGGYDAGQATAMSVEQVRFWGKAISEAEIISIWRSR